MKSIAFVKMVYLWKTQFFKGKSARYWCRRAWRSTCAKLALFTIRVRLHRLSWWFAAQAGFFEPKGRRW